MDLRFQNILVPEGTLQGWPHFHLAELFDIEVILH